MSRRRRHNAWAAIVRHVLRQHREVGRGWEPFAEATIEVEVCLKQRVIAYVLAKTGPIIGVGQVDVVAMDYVHVPTHQPHLESKDAGLLPSYERMNWMAKQSVTQTNRMPNNI